MASLTSPPVVRTGKCSLILVIDSRRYRVSPAPPVVPGAKIWHLRVLSGQIRAGKVYSVCSIRRRVDCTCPDSTQNHAVCKHVRALQALGLVAKTTKPSLQRFTLVLHTDRHAGTSRGCPWVSRGAAPDPRHHRAHPWSWLRLDGDPA